MTADASTCDICQGESGGTYVGVACVPGAPVSVAWCSECLRRDSAPSFVFHHDFIFVAHGDVTQLNEWARQRVTWADGGYIDFDTYVKRITPEQVEKEMADYERVMQEANERERPDPPKVQP